MGTNSIGSKFCHSSMIGCSSALIGSTVTITKTMMARTFVVVMLMLAACCAESTNRGWYFRKSVNGGVYKVGETIALETVDDPAELGNGELRIKLVATSVIPSYRMRMDIERFPQNPEYPAFELNKLLMVDVVGEVVESKGEGYEAGDWVLGVYPLAELQNVRVDGTGSLFGFPPMKVDKSVPLEKYFSVMSFAGGLTALYAVEYLEEGKVSSPCDKTVLVTSASSTVGQVAGQLYKAKGCKVIGSTSTREKANKVLSMGGFDDVIAYREEDFETKLKELAPEGIDLDFENVGGPQLDAALRAMNNNGKVLLCGAVHDYNLPEDKVHGIKAVGEIILKRITVKGMFVMDLLPNLVEAVGTMGGLVGSGAVTSEETTVYGFHTWGDRINMMLESKSMGRLVIRAGDGGEKAEL